MQVNSMEGKGKVQNNFVLPTEDHIYELADFGSTAKDDFQQAESLKKVPKRSAWNTQFIVLVVLLCIMLILLLAILCLMLFRITEDNVSPTTANVNMNNPPKFENADIIFEMIAQAISNITELFNNCNNSITQSIPDFNKWANGIVSKVNSSVTGSLPDFGEWANGVVSKVNSNVTQSLPDFNEWANGVVSKVNSSVTGSLPDFNEWANGVVSKVNSNVTGSLPDFNEWANGVVSKVNSNVTGSLPDFNEWANGVVSKVNSSVTGSLPDFNEWANGVVSKVNSSVTGSLPDFNEWANGVVSKVNSNVTGSLPDFNDWANGVVSEVNSNVTGSLPDFNKWANGVVSQVNSNVTGSLPDFGDWANGVVQNTFQLLHSNFTELDEQILHTTKGFAHKLNNIVNALSNLHDTSTSTAGVVNEILLVAQELIALHNESTPLPTSCEELKSQHPSSLSGYYVLATDNETYTAYCNMDELCGSGGGWTRLAYLDMSDATVNCPSGFRLYQSGGVRACGRLNSGCVSVIFPSQNLSYSQICGRVKGYQYGTTDAIQPSYVRYSYWYSYNIRNNINTYYVDGVSITRGSYREHVWTLMSGYAQDSTSSSSCPCNTGSSVSVQYFIGNNYFCESGNYGSASTTLHTNDPLWDGQGCASNEAPCCNVPGIPWFHRDYGSTTTTDYIELRVCADESVSNEDAPVSYYEIYVK